MTTLDALRKEYDKLNPFERAVMRIEAADRMDKAAMEALEAPSLWDAYHAAECGTSLAMLAFKGVCESRRGDTNYWRSKAVLGMLERSRLMGKRKAGEEYDDELDSWVDHAKEGEREARAWLLALEALDNETGGGCMPFARLIAGEYIQGVLGREYAEDMEYSAELDHLRMLWNVCAERSPSMPEAKEPAATEVRQ